MTNNSSWRIFIVIMLFFTAISHTQAQTLPIPRIDSVSMTFDNKVCIGWSVENADAIKKFVIYRKRTIDFAYLPLDTVYVTSPWVWYDNNVDLSSERWFYSVAAMSVGDTISGLASPHTYITLALGQYEICHQKQHFQRTNYVGWENATYEMICETNSGIFFRSPMPESIASVPVVPGVENRIYVRARWNSNSSTSMSIMVIPDIMQIDTHVGLRRIENKGLNFEVEVYSSPSRDRRSVILNYFSTDTEVYNFQQEVALATQSVSFTIPVKNLTGSFSVAVKDICDSIYLNPHRVQAIGLNMIERPNGVYLSWNEPEGYPNLNYTVFLNDGYDRVIAQLSGQTQHYHQFYNAAISVSSICFWIVGSNDTLTWISNQRCINTDEDLIWPNAFIPDGDGFDEVFRPVVKRFYPDTYSLEIFDKKAHRLFISNHVDQGWNGKYQGVLVPLGAYIWRSNYTISGKKYQKQGVVNVIY